MDPNPPSSSSSGAGDAPSSAAVRPLSSATSAVAAAARGVPADRDFHYLNNFPAFRSPAAVAAAHAGESLKSISAASSLWGPRQPAPPPSDHDDAYDWLVSLNDDLLEQAGVAMDEFKALREKSEALGVKSVSGMADDGFTVVGGKKKKKIEAEVGGISEGGRGEGVRMAVRDKKTMMGKAKVPFHIPTLVRPQDEYKILVNNSSQPFKHVWLEKSADGSRDVHPLEKLSLLDFFDKIVGDGDPVKPLPLESTPFKFVTGLKELKELAEKLRAVDEFAVDLEHNSYRSYQGLTCLMQISTRTEDFIIDTLKLRVQIGPYLREVFKDPTKRKVMHGADRDIVWLQRDFAIYVCNLFDTGQASRVLELERNSLEFLLQHYCGVTANKEYQNADWRLRPLPEEMVKYAREDTHYLLHIFDLMKSSLLSKSSSENDLLLEVYKRSYEICMQLYEKDILTDTTFLHIYGLQQADFDANQLAIVFGLCGWRDKIAREEDESTGYILPNKALLEIAKHMPLSSGKLRRLVKSKYPYVERNLNSVIGIIRNSIDNSSSFESICEQLKVERQRAAENVEVQGNSKSPHATEDLMESSSGLGDTVEGPSSAGTLHNGDYTTTSLLCVGNAGNVGTSEVFSRQILVSRGHEEKLQSTLHSGSACSVEVSSTVEEEKVVSGLADAMKSSKKAIIPAVQVSKRQSSAFGALLGSSSRRKSNPYNGDRIAQEENVNMVEQIKSTFALPFRSFSGGDNCSKPTSDPVVVTHPQQEIPKESLGQQSGEATKLEEIIQLENESDSSETHEDGCPEGDDDTKHMPWFPQLPRNGIGKPSQSRSEAEEGQMSLSDLSSSFQECFQSINERRGLKPTQRPPLKVESSSALKPFDYAAARKNMKFGQDREADGGEHGEDGSGASHTVERRKNRATNKSNNAGERSAGFQAPRRRQAFPVSGNRSETF